MVRLPWLRFSLRSACGHPLRTVIPSASNALDGSSPVPAFVVLSSRTARGPARIGSQITAFRQSTLVCVFARPLPRPAPPALCRGCHRATVHAFRASRVPSCLPVAWSSRRASPPNAAVRAPRAGHRSVSDRLLRTTASLAARASVAVARRRGSRREARHTGGTVARFACNGVVVSIRFRRLRPRRHPAVGGRLTAGSRDATRTTPVGTGRKAGTGSS